MLAVSWSQWFFDVSAQGFGDLVAGVFLVWLAVRWEARADADRDRRHEARDRKRNRDERR